MKVLFVTSEAYPFAATGGLGDVSGALPVALRKRFVGCRVVLPLYENVSSELKSSMKFITSISVPVSWRRQYCGIFEAKYKGVTYYLLDNQYYFKRPNMYGYYDDAERFAFLARAALEILPAVGFKPDVIHCNDWQTALLPTYYHLYYAQNAEFSDIKTIITIHNIQYQGEYGNEVLEDVFGIPYDRRDLLENGSNINILKGAIETANAITTVSPTYAKEILDPWFSHGLDSILNERSYKLSGIVNGIDVELYNPETDKMIFAPYNATNTTNKAINKAELQKMMGLEVKKDVPLIAMVSRMVGHKGFDLVKYAFDEIMRKDIQFIMLGSGEWTFESYFDEMAVKYPQKFALKKGFIPDLAHKIYAGADIFLMPSKSEPCGLAQMLALRYGTIPIVRETGGLKDTISDCGDGEGNGFRFATYNADDMTWAINRALDAYNQKEGWEILVKRAMLCDNSWKRSAGEYLKLYKGLVMQ